VQRAGQEAQQLQCAAVDLAQPGLVVVGSASHLTAETQDFVAQLQEPTFKQLGSSLKLLMVCGLGLVGRLACLVGQSGSSVKGAAVMLLGWLCSCLWLP